MEALAGASFFICVVAGCSGTIVYRIARPKWLPIRELARAMTAKKIGEVWRSSCREYARCAGVLYPAQRQAGTHDRHKNYAGWISDVGVRVAVGG